MYLSTLHRTNTDTVNLSMYLCVQYDELASLPRRWHHGGGCNAVMVLFPTLVGTYLHTYSTHLLYPLLTLLTLLTYLNKNTTNLPTLSYLLTLPTDYQTYLPTYLPITNLPTYTTNLSTLTTNLPIYLQMGL